VVLRGPGTLVVEEIPIPLVPAPRVEVEMRACGICGSDVRYLRGENPWALHTLGRNLPSPPNMVLGHEVAGITCDADRRRVAILAYRACGSCRSCRAGNEHLCADMEHFGHSAGWPSMPHYPGGMAQRFTIWQGFAYEIPDSIGFEEATFLDGLAVAVHACDTGGVAAGSRVGVIGLGPIGLMAAQVAASRRAAAVFGVDTSRFRCECAARVGIDRVSEQGAAGLADLVRGARGTRDGEGPGCDAVIDTVGTAEAIGAGIGVLSTGGRHVLLAVHGNAIPVVPTTLSGERCLLTSANNRYRDFAKAIELLGSGRVRAKELVTHVFPLARTKEAFAVASDAETHQAFKVVIVP
jgi:threonine dehydrogenase-like Zn-dependent dehydrogenase